MRYTSLREVGLSPGDKDGDFWMAGMVREGCLIWIFKWINLHILTVICDAGQSIVVGGYWWLGQPGIIPMLLQIQLTSAEFSSHMNKAMRDLSESKVENNTAPGCGPQGPQHALSWTSSTDDSDSASTTLNLYTNICSPGFPWSPWGMRFLGNTILYLKPTLLPF